MANDASNSPGPADKAARDALLDELLVATNEWAATETERIASEAAFLESALTARGGAALTDSANVEKGTVLAADSIGFFLRGS